MPAVLYHIEAGQKKIGAHKKLTGQVQSIGGDCTNLFGEVKQGLRGDCTGKSGDVSDKTGDFSSLYGTLHKKLKGNVSGLIGCATNIIGECTGVQGNIDLCEISEKDRKKLINITNLIK